MPDPTLTGNTIPSNKGLDLSIFRAPIDGAPIGNGLPFAPDDYGKSKYDNKFWMLPDKYNQYNGSLNTMRDQAQPFIDKLGNGLAKFGGTFASGILSTPGTFVGLYGTLANAFDGKWDPSSFWDNSFNKVGQALVDYTNNNFVNYKGDKEALAKWYSPDAWATSNFWTDTILGNAGYGAAAFATGYGVSGLINKAAPLLVGGKLASILAGSEELAAGGESVLNSDSFANAATAIDKASRNLKYFDRLNKGISLALSVSGEASTEAYSAYNELKQAKIENFSKLNGRLPQDKELDQIERESHSAGNMTYALNLPILAGADILQFGSLLGRKWESELSQLSTNTFALEAGEELGKYQLSKEVKRPIIGALRDVILKENVTEAAQEGLQFIASEGSKNFYMRKYDPKGQDTVQNLIDSFGDASSRLFNTQEGGMNMLAGFFTPMVMPHTYMNIHHEIKEKSENTKQSVDLLNSYNLQGAIKDIGDNLIRASSIEAEASDAVRRNDRKSYEDLKNDRLKSWVLSRIQSGRYDLFESELDKMSDMRKDEFSSFFGISPDKFDSVKQELGGLKDKARDLKESWDKIDSLYSGRFMNLTGTAEEKADKKHSIDMYKMMVWNYYADFKDKDKRVNTLSSEITDLTGKFFGANDILTNSNPDPALDKWINQYKTSAIGEHLLKDQEPSEETDKILKKLRADKAEAQSNLQRLTEQRTLDRKNRTGVDLSSNFDDILKNSETDYIENFTKDVNTKLSKLDPEQVHLALASSGVSTSDFIRRSQDMISLANERRLALIAFNNLNKANRLEEFINYSSKKVTDPDTNETYSIPDIDKMKYFNKEEYERMNSPLNDEASQQSAQDLSDDIKNFTNSTQGEDGKPKFTNPDFVNKVNKLVYEGEDKEEPYINLTPKDLNSKLETASNKLNSILNDFPKLGATTFSVETEDQLKSLRDNKEEIKDLLAQSQAIKQALQAQDENSEISNAKKNSKASPKNKTAAQRKAIAEATTQQEEENLSPQELQDKAVQKDPKIADTPEPIKIVDKEEFQPDESLSNVGVDNSAYILVAHSDILTKDNKPIYENGQNIINYNSPFTIKVNGEDKIIQTGYQREVFDPASKDFLKPGDRIKAVYLGDSKNEKVIGLYTNTNKFIGFLPSDSNKRISDLSTTNPELSDNIKSQLSLIRSQLGDINSSTILNTKTEWFAISRGHLFFNENDSTGKPKFISVGQAFNSDLINLTPTEAMQKGGVFLSVISKGDFSYRDPGTNQLRSFDSNVSIDQNNKLRDSYYDGQIAALVPTNNVKDGKRVYMPVLLSTEDQYSPRLNQALTIRQDAQGNNESLPVGLLRAILDPGDAKHANELNSILSTLTGKSKVGIQDLYNDTHTIADLFDKLIYTDTRSVDKKSVKSPFSLQVLKNADPNDSSRFQISLQINISRSVDRTQKIFKIDIANNGKFLSTPIPDRVEFQRNNNQDKSIEYIDFDELKSHLENKPYRIDSRELYLGQAGNKTYQGFVFNKQGELTLTNFKNYKEYISQLGLLNTNIHGQDYTNSKGEATKFYFANQQVRFEAPIKNSNSNPTISQQVQQGTNTITQPTIEPTKTVNQDLKPNFKKNLFTKNAETLKLQAEALKESTNIEKEDKSNKPAKKNILAGVLNDDIAQKLKQAALADNKESYDYLDTDKINSLNQLVYEPLGDNPEVQNEIVQYTRKAILNVMYDNYVNNNNQNLSFERLKQATKNSIQAVRDGIHDISINSTDAEERDYANSTLSYYDYLLLHHNDKVDLFDYRDSNEYKQAVQDEKNYKGFVGFFNLALGDIYSMGIITPTSSYEDVVDFNINDGNYTDRFQENWALKINPKDTINIRSKIFLAMLPQLERIVDESTKESYFEQQTDGLGSTKYYELNNVVEHLLDISSDVKAEDFYNELFGQSTIVNGEQVDTDEYKNDPIIKSLRDRISERKEDNQTIDTSQIFNQLSTSMLKQRKTLLTIRMTSNLKTKVPSINIIDSSRTRVTNQIIEHWVNEFKDQLKDHFISQSDTTTDDPGSTTAKLNSDSKKIFTQAEEYVNKQLDSPVKGNGHYEDEVYKNLAKMMARVGISLSENKEESWIILKNLNNNLGKASKGKVQKKLFQKYNPKNKTFKDFFHENFNQYILKELTKAANKNKLTLNDPFANSATALDTWAKISKSNYSQFINATITNVNGDSVYTYTGRNFLSNQMLKIKDENYLSELLKVPFSMYNPIIQDLHDNPQFRSDIKLAFADGLKKDNWQIISTDNAEPGSLELLSLLYYQNNEKFEGGRRNMGWYMTTHSDQTTAPLYKMNKYFPELHFNQDNTIELQRDSATYNNFYGIFKSEVARINQSYKNYTQLLANTSNLSGKDLMDALHNSNYKEGYDYNLITEDGKTKLVPGSGIDLYLFGQDNYRNNSHGLYNTNGLVNDNKSFRPYGGLDPDVLNNGEVSDEGLKKVFDKIINPYINQLVDSKLKSLAPFEQYMYEINHDYETFIDPTTQEVFKEKNSEFSSKVLDPNYIRGIKKFFEKLNTFTNEDNEVKDIAQHPDKAELLWKYIIADHTLNYSQFLSTWNQMHHDPAFYAKGNSYESFFDNFMKRLKGDVSPGDINYTNEQDKVHYLVFKDIAAKDIKRDVTKEEHDKLPDYVKSFLKEYYNINASSFEDNKLTLPERFHEYATIYHTLDDKVQAKGIISHYENIKIADAQAYITLKEFLYRKWKDGLINSDEHEYLLNKYSNPDIKFTEEEYRKDFKLQALKYVYSGNDISNNNLEYHFNKNAELPLIPALTKGRVLDKIRQSMEDIENSIYKDSESSINPGVVAVPISSYKVGADKVTSILDKYGNYTGSFNTDKVVSVPRENLKKQIQNPIKNELYNTASSQFNKYIHNDLSYTERFALDKFAEDPSELEKNPNKNTLNKGLSNNQMQDTKNSAFLELMKRDLINLMDEFGLKETGEGIDRELVLADINKLVNTLKKEAFTRKGLDLNSIQYLSTIGNKLNIPIDFIPTGSSFESVILSRFNSIINGRKLPGYSFVQSSNMGLHEFNKDNTTVKQDSNLKGARLILDEQGNTVGYTPAEIALTWKFRDSNGDLLPYDDYVNQDGTPKYNKIDKELLDIIGLRIPNTGPNSAGRYSIAKFFPPAYSDTVAVPPELIAQMGSDFDFDKLVSYIYNYNVDSNGKMYKIQSVIHHTQLDAKETLLSDKNKQDFAERFLTDNNEDYRTLLKRERAIGISIKDRSRELSNQLKSITKELRDASTNNTKIDSTLSRKVAEVLDTEDLINQYQKYLKNDKSLQAYFKDNDIDLTDMSQEDQEVTKTSEVEQIKETIDDLKELYNNLNESIELLNDKKIDTDDIETERKKLLNLEDNPTQNALKELKSVQDSKDQMLLEVVDNTKFDDMNLKNYNVLYGLQSKEAIENSIIDVYHHMMSSMSLFKKQITPLTSNWIADKILGKNISSPDGNSYSIKDLLDKSKFLSISSENSMSNNRLINADADKMIGIGANAQSAITKAQRFNLSLQQSFNKQGELIFGHPLLFKDNNNNIKTEDKFEDIPKDNQSYYNQTNPYENPLTQGRYRLDRLYSIDNNNNKIYNSEIVQSILQAALDNQNEPILGYGNINNTTINAALVQALLGYSDEIVPLINQQIVTELTSLKRIVTSPLYDGDFTKRDVTKNVLIKKYAEQAGVDIAKINAILEQEDLNEVDLIDKLTPTDILSEKDLKDLLLHSSGITNSISSQEFARLQLSALRAFLVADYYGQQMLTYQSATSAESKGLGDSSMIGVKEGYDKYENLYKVNSKGQVNTSVPNISGIYRMIYGTPEFRSNPFSAAHAMGPKKVMNTFSWNKLQMFYSISPLFNQVVDNVYTNLKRRDINKKKEISLNFKSFVLSNPEIYKNLFSPKEEEQYNNFFNNPYDYLLKEHYAQDDTTGEYDLNINSKESLATAFERIARANNSQKVPYSLMYEVLTSFKTLTQQDNEKFSLVNYVNSNNYKENLDYRLSKSILSMVNSKDQQIKNLGRDLILYGFMTGGVNNPNSFVKFIPVETLQKIGFGEKLKSKLTEYSNSVSNSDTIPNQFLVQFMQHKSHNVKDKFSPKHVEDFNRIDNGIISIKLKDSYFKLDNEGDPIIPQVLAYGDGKKRILFALQYDGSYISIPKAGYNTFGISEYNPNNNIIFSNLSSNYNSKSDIDNLQKQLTTTTLEDKDLTVSQDSEGEETLPQDTSKYESTDTTELPEYLHNTTVQSALEYIRSTGTDEQSVLALHLQENLKDDLVVRLNDDLDSAGKFIYSDDPKDPGIIEYNTEVSDRFPDPNTMFKAVITHEAAHALTVKTLRDVIYDKYQDSLFGNISKITATQRTAVANLGTLIEILNEKIPNNKIYKSLDVQTQYVIQRGLGNTGDILNTTSITQANSKEKIVAEFIANLYAEPDFRKVLNSIPANTKESILDKIWKNILTLLNIQPGSALAEAFSHVENLINQQEEFTNTPTAPDIRTEEEKKTTPKKKSLFDPTAQDITRQMMRGMGSPDQYDMREFQDADQVYKLTVGKQNSYTASHQVGYFSEQQAKDAMNHSPQIKSEYLGQISGNPKYFFVEYYNPSYNDNVVSLKNLNQLGFKPGPCQ